MLQMIGGRSGAADMTRACRSGTLVENLRARYGHAKPARIRLLWRCSSRATCTSRWTSAGTSSSGSSATAKKAEPVDLSGFEIEHVMPQELSEGRKASLGPKYSEEHDRYLHTLGNLTLTMRNPELDNRGFEDKRRIYAGSRIWLTQSLPKYDRWGGEQMEQRAAELAETAVEVWGCAVEVWGCPAGYDGAPDERGSEDLEGERLEGKAADLWNLAKARIGAECGTEFRMKRKYGTFSAALRGREHILCWLVAYRHRIDVFYNAKRGDGTVPGFEFVKDVSGARHLGGGDYKSELRTEDDADAAVEIVKSL